MAIHDFTSERLFVEAPLAEGASVACSPEQVNYLINVLRMKPGAALLVFNGRDGEWRARLDQVSKRVVVLMAEAQTRPQSDGPDIDYLFAPLKHARLDYMVQKATEMGVRRLRPVLTRRTIAERVNLDRMRSNAIEAAEQCGVLRVPEVLEPVKLAAVLEAWDAERVLIFCDEGAVVANPMVALGAVERGPLGVLIGPEGGFADDERDAIRGRPYTRAISLGPRILRADTAAVAALAVVNAVLGDWN
jgi:16S rRNA (uracil1498-N3)-methyltransferase